MAIAEAATEFSLVSLPVFYWVSLNLNFDSEKNRGYIINSHWCRQVPNLEDILGVPNCSKLNTGLNALPNKPLPLKSNHGNNAAALESATFIYYIMNG